MKAQLRPLTEQHKVFLNIPRHEGVLSAAATSLISMEHVYTVDSSGDRGTENGFAGAQGPRQAKRVTQGRHERFDSFPEAEPSMRTCQSPYGSPRIGAS